jgi:cytochrome c biogenesis protein CcmG/thiol:disulfide interchange protein DsbE
MRRYLPVVVVVLLAGGFALAEVLGGGAGDSASSRPAPELPRQVLVGPRITLASLRGKPAVVHFWASWCDPCRREAPELARLPAALHGRARLVGVDWNDGLGPARLFVQRYRWRFPSLVDASGAVGDRFGLTGMPTTYILDRYSRIRATLRGPQSIASVKAALKKVGL